MKFHILSLPKLLKDSKPWGLRKSFWDSRWYLDYYPQQRTSPDSKGLLSKLGFRTGEKILCLAAFKANWTLALAKAGVKVVYSDVSRELVQYVKKQVKHKNLVKYACVDYSLYPDKVGLFDWSFSFEAVGPKPFILLRALLNNKGGKYVVWDESSHAKNKLEQLRQTIAVCKQLYAAPGSIRRISVRCQDRLGVWAKRPHVVVTVRSSSKARSRIKLDLALLVFLNKSGTKVSKLSLCHRYKCSEETIEQSLHRLQAWSKLLPERKVKEIIVI
ncbi:MAG: hypothetical protein AABX70_07725 [Nanoarchaeota archaeon]